MMSILQDCRPRTPLPDRDTIARRIRAGVPASVPTHRRIPHHMARRPAGPGRETPRGYSDHIRLYLTPHLGHVPIQQLGTRHIEAMFTALEHRNAEIRSARASDDPAVRATVKGIRPPGPASLQRLRATLRKALNDAIHKAKLRDTNPAVGVELESGKRPKARVWTDKAVARRQATRQRPSPVMVWTPAQAGAFLDYAHLHDTVLYPMYMLILHRRLRRGEACGLCDDDVDLDAGHLTIAQQITC